MEERIKRVERTRLQDNSEADKQEQDKVREAGERGDVVCPKWGVVGGGLERLRLAVAEISIETKPHPRCRPRSCPWSQARPHAQTSLKLE